MKRIAIALLVALFVMSSLSATSGDVVGTGAETLVSLNLNENFLNIGSVRQASL